MQRQVRTLLTPSILPKHHPAHTKVLNKLVDLAKGKLAKLCSMFPEAAHASKIIQVVMFFARKKRGTELLALALVSRLPPRQEYLCFR